VHLVVSVGLIAFKLSPPYDAIIIQPTAINPIVIGMQYGSGHALRIALQINFSRKKFPNRVDFKRAVKRIQTIDVELVVTET
jgi:hypothetical protein